MPKKQLAPILKFRNIEPLEDYYANGEYVYSVARMISESKGLPVFDMPLAGLNLSDIIWADCDIWGIAFHVHKVNEADLDYPIILDWQGRIADGRHRVIKALSEGRRTIKAVRITWKMTPDRDQDPKD